MLQHCKTGTKHLSTLPDFELRKREESLWAASVKDWKHEMEMNNVPKKILPKKYGAARAGTLVVCPLIALSQWKAEIEKFSAPGSLTVGIYHGPNRTSEIPAEMIQKYDVLLTTYNVIEQDFRKMVSPNKVTCPNCSGKFKIDKLRIHLKYFCGETAQRTEAQSRQRRSQGRNRGNAKNKRPTSSMKSKKGNVTVVKKKKIIQAKRLEGYDSEGNISVGQGWTGQVEPTSMNRRPSRAAAQTASQKLTISVKEWGAKIPKAKGKAFDISDESNFSSVAESESTDTDSSSLEDEGLVDLRVSRRKTSATAFELAKQRQADAIAAAKKGKGMSFTPKKKPVGKKKDPPKWKSKKFDNESSSDDNVDDYAVDPMDGIDINELLEEAMAGSRCSLLHSFCWWRVVLDEAHFIKSRSSQTAASAFALTSIHRWCLSGTPLESH